MPTQSLLSLAWDTWRAGRGGALALQTRQQARLAAVVADARRASSFYAHKYRGLPEHITDIRQLPPVTKPELMEHFDEAVTDPAITRQGVAEFVAQPDNIGHLFLDRYLICTTSGTTGVPAVIVYDQQMLNVVGALNIARSVPAWLTWGELARIMGSGARTAAVWATGGHFLGISMARRQILERPSRARQMRIFSVLTPFDQLVEQLNTFQPAMLNGYATAVSLLADEQEAGRLHIHPSLVLTSSETLAAGERERIAGVFGAKVRDNYGCSEFVALGYDCGHGWLHLNSDWAIVEPVDEHGQPVAPGETSRAVLLTNLANRVLPILRYELGDRLTLNPEPCACGSALPAVRVEGRTDDVLRFETPAGRRVPILPLALWSVIKETPGVGRFQAIQTGPERLSIRLEAKHAEETPAVCHAVQSQTHAYLTTQGLGHVAVTLSDEPPQRDPRSGKFRQVWADLRADGAPAVYDAANVADRYKELA